MATKWLMGGDCIQHGYFGQRDESQPGQDGAGQCEMSSCYSEWHTI